MEIQHFAYSFICWWTLGLLPYHYFDILFSIIRASKFSFGPSLNSFLCCCCCSSFLFLCYQHHLLAINTIFLRSYTGFLLPGISHSVKILSAVSQSALLADGYSVYLVALKCSCSPSPPTGTGGSSRQALDLPGLGLLAPTPGPEPVLGTQRTLLAWVSLGCFPHFVIHFVFLQLKLTHIIYWFDACL